MRHRYCVICGSTLSPVRQHGLATLSYQCGSTVPSVWRHYLTCVSVLSHLSGDIVSPVWQDGFGDLLDAADADELLEAGVEQTEQHTIDGDVRGRRDQQLASLTTTGAAAVTLLHVDVTCLEKAHQQLHHDAQQEALASAKHACSKQ